MQNKEMAQKRAFGPGVEGRGPVVRLMTFRSVLHTWPLATAPATLSRNDNGDAQLNEWILAWVAHELPHVPAQLFQGNIFYPARDTLAFSEPLIVPSLLGAPLAWLGGSPVLVFNMMVLAGFALSALAGYALVFTWTGDRMAGLLAGATFAFNTHTRTRSSVELDGALAPAHERVQRLRARDVRRVSEDLLVFPASGGHRGDAPRRRDARDGPSRAVPRPRRDSRRHQRNTRARVDGGRIAGSEAVPPPLSHPGLFLTARRALRLRAPTFHARYGETSP